MSTMTTEKAAGPKPAASFSARLSARLRKTVLQEPLVHFALVALALYWVFDVSGAQDSRVAEATLHINQTVVSALTSSFRAQHQRTPSTNEINRLVNDYIEEEALVREAVRMGLDQDDPVIRRRLVQKMHFLFQELEEDVPTQVYRSYYQQHLSDYRQSASVDFEQVYFKSDTPDPFSFNALHPAGDAFALGNRFHQTSAASISKWFGADFYARLTALPLQQWQGPLESAYGSHYVRVEARQPATQLTFEEALPNVQADYQQARQRTKRAQRIAQIVAQQPVRIEPAVQQLIAQGRKS